MGKFADFGIDDKFIKELSTELKPGNSALFVMFRQATADKAVPELAKYGGTVLRTTLSNETEAKLQAELLEGWPGPQRQLTSHGCRVRLWNAVAPDTGRPMRRGEVGDSVR